MEANFGESPFVFDFEGLLSVSIYTMSRLSKLSFSLLVYCCVFVCTVYTC